MVLRQPVGSRQARPSGSRRPGVRFTCCLLAATALSLTAAPMLMAAGEGDGNSPAAAGPATAPAPLRPEPAPLSAPAESRPAAGQSPPSGLSQPGPLRPPARGIQAETLRPNQPFDQSLDRLEREGAISPQERRRSGFGNAKVTPKQQPAFREACRQGAITARECAAGFVVQYRGRTSVPNGQAPDGTPLPVDPDGTAAIAGSPWPEPATGSAPGTPLATPLTVPVSALLAGEAGSFSLAGVFGRTPRPAPASGNGNRRLLFPLIGSAVTSSEFGYRLHPVLGSWLMHAGKDLAAPEGTPVVAALSGRVVSSGLAGGYGLAIEIEHDNPRRRTLYGHLSELYVKPGERVRQGEVIGRVGSTGLSTGPHLHFELRLPGEGGWVAVDPGDLDPGSAATGSDAIALLMGQLLQRLERPGSPLQARALSDSPAPQRPTASATPNGSSAVRSAPPSGKPAAGPR